MTIKKISLLRYVWLLCFFAVIYSCKKSDYIDNPNAVLIVKDSIKFDTVFTSQGSATRIFKIYNLNKQKLRLDDITLSGGNKSFFQLNVNGVAGTQFPNIDIDAGDSIYCFVRVNIDPTNASSPFLVSDSMGIHYNGNTKYVQLQAYGQNAVYMTNTAITRDTGWKKNLPIVLLQTITVPESTTLTIEKGTKIYCHTNAGLLVDGQLLATGDTASADRISFATDRLDYVDNPTGSGVDYKNLAGAWPGIDFGSNSSGNVLKYVTIRNAVYGITDTLNTQTPSMLKLDLQGCIIQNNSGYGVLSRLGNMSIVNSLIANNGSGVGLYNGGQYTLTYNTLVGYSNLYVSHNNPTAILNGTPPEPLKVAITNCIIWGDNSGIENEIGISSDLDGSNATVKIDHSLAKYSSLPSWLQLSNMLQNVDPGFVLVNNDFAQYDFRLEASSPCLGAAVPVSGIVYDLSGNKRNVLKPAIGCYENP
ncbi:MULTISPECIES: hypothetical protein [Chitinophagaceae]